MLGQVGRNFSAKLMGIALSFLDRFFVVAVLLRSWGTETYADWALIGSAAGLLSLAELGLNVYYGNVWQKCHDRSDAVGFQRMLAIALACSVALGTVLALLLALLLVTVDVRAAISLSTLGAQEAQLVLALLALSTITRLTRGAVSQVYRGRGNYALGSIVDQVSMAGTIFATLLAAVMGATPVVLAAIYLACDVVLGWGFTLFDLKRRFPGLSFQPSIPTRAELVDIGGHVRWLAVQQGAPLVWTQAPVLLLGALGVGGAAFVGFVILRTLVGLARQVATMLVLSTGVELVRRFHTGQSEAAERHLTDLAVFVSALVSASAVAIMLFGAPFVAVWTSRSELFDPMVCAWLLVAALLSVPNLPLQTMLTLLNAPRAGALALVAQVVVGLAALPILVVHYGAAGAAAALALGEALAALLVLPQLARGAVRFDPLHHYARCFAVMLLAGGWCALVGAAVVTIVGTGGVLVIVSSAVLFASLGLLPVLVAALPAGIRDRLTSRLHRSPRPAPGDA